MVEQFNSGGSGDLYKYSGPDNTMPQGRQNNNNPDLYRWSNTNQTPSADQTNTNPDLYRWSNTNQGRTGDQYVNGQNQSDTGGYDPFAGERMGMRQTEKPCRQIHRSPDGSTVYINNFYKSANVIENAPAEGDYRTNPNLDFRNHICHCQDQQRMRQGYYYNNSDNQYNFNNDSYISGYTGGNEQSDPRAEQARLRARQQVIDGTYRQSVRQYTNQEPTDAPAYYSNNGGSGYSINGNSGNGYFADRNSANGYFPDGNANGALNYDNGNVNYNNGNLNNYDNGNLNYDNGNLNYDNGYSTLGNQNMYIDPGMSLDYPQPYPVYVQSYPVYPHRHIQYPGQGGANMATQMVRQQLSSGQHRGRGSH